MIPQFKCKKVTRFFVSKGALVGDFRSAISPMVWRTDLSRLQTMSFKLIKNDGAWDLALYEGKSEPEVISSFSSQIAGDQALAALAKALQTRSIAGRIGKALLLLVTFLLVALALLWAVPAATSLFSGGSGHSQTVKHAVGKELPADDVLQIPAQ